MNRLQKVCELPDNLQNILCIRLNNKKFQLLMIHQNGNFILHLMYFRESDLEIAKEIHDLKKG